MNTKGSITVSRRMNSSNKHGPGDSGVKIVVEGKGGHGHATVPATPLAPVRIHLSKLLVPVDFSEPAKKAIHYAKTFADQFGATITLIHAAEPLAYPPDFAVVPLLPPDAEEVRIQELQRQLEALAHEVGGNTKALVLPGRAWQTIVDHAKADGTDIIVLSTHGYTGFKHALLGSVTEKIVRHAPCPVLVVRDEEHDFA